MITMRITRVFLRNAIYSSSDNSLWTVSNGANKIITLAHTKAIANVYVNSAFSLTSLIKISLNKIAPADRISHLVSVVAW